MSVVQKTLRNPAASMPATRQPDAGSAPPTLGRNSRMKRLAGRLNLFQRTMLDWRELHPYIAVHAARITVPLDRAAAKRAIDSTLEETGLTGLELDRRRGRYEWRGGRSASELEVVSAGSDWPTTVAAVF